MVCEEEGLLGGTFFALDGCKLASNASKEWSGAVKETVNDGVIYRRYSNDEEGCEGCELKARCIRRNKAKRRSVMVRVGSVPGRLTKAMAAEIDSEKGRGIYHRRIAIAEPVFANIRVRKVMNRFTLRGRIKVNIQWLLYCMVHNIGKILNFGFKYAFS